MKVIKIKYNNISQIEPNLSLCLGFFDGLHIGHQDLIENALMLTNNPLGLLTFDKPVSEFIRNGKSTEVLTSLDDRFRILSRYNIKYFIVIEIDQEFLDYSPEKFINDVLIRLGTKEIFCGEDYRFGCLAKGDTNLLKNYFDVHVIELLKDKGIKVSSSDITKLLKEGNVKEANRLLGHQYEVMGIVEKGYGRGTKLGFPTANLKLTANYVIPRFGVYKCIAYVRGIPHISIVNVGVHPTVGSLPKPLIEVHIPNFTEITYGMTVYLEFLDFVRPEVKLNSVEELKAQIAKDLEVVKIDFI
ncbi:MAG: riboflavin biosynthesis protein RibF [Bacilli bacterium]|nr:riboflavin biosynthesis protein RibF [Bacilli bacterium]